jgi:uncharacterized protein YdhG (YjbR/CyaY superfamily)
MEQAPAVRRGFRAGRKILDVAKARFASVSEYIASKPKASRVALERVRRAIRKAVPAAKEELSYQVPTYVLNGVPVMYFAGWKTHYSLFPATDALVAAFARELAPYKRSKGTIRMPMTEPVPERLIERIARFRAKQITARDKHRGKGRDAQLDRVRRLCARLPSVSEKTSHGTPTFFVEKDKGVFAMFADNHHQDGHLALWVPVKEGLQPLLIEDAPATYYKPPYVGSSGWVGIELDQIRDDALQEHLREAWGLVARKQNKRRPPALTCRPRRDGRRETVGLRIS